jgi:Short repeats of unknown function/Pretoxin HINT domain
MNKPLRLRARIAALTVLVLLAGILRATPALAVEEPVAADRAAVVNAWRTGGAQLRAVAETALLGSDDQVRAFLDGGWQEAQRLDERDAVARAISDGGPAVRAAAKAALDAADAGNAGALNEFLARGWHTAADVDARVSVNQLMATGGPQVRQAAQKALDAGDPAAMRKFADSGWQAQWVTDQRLRVNQAVATGGPQVKAAGQRALDLGTPEALEQFLEYGWAVASAREDEVASLTDLLAQAKAAGDLAAQETQAAKEEGARAKEAAEGARRAAAAAAAATEAARENSELAGMHANRAAAAAEQAAQAARVAVGAAAAASRAARAAATAASRTAAAAARAGQAASAARKAAADAETDRWKAEAARDAADNARDVATITRDYWTAVAAAQNSIQAGLDALGAAESAANNAMLAAEANDAAVQAANEAGADASAAVAAAQRARAEANRARRAVEAAERYLRVAIDAAAAARAAAERAVANAEEAARAADEAADHAGQAVDAAQRATAHAEAATAAAQDAVDAATQAVGVFEAARQADNERLAVAKDQGIEAARAADTQYQAQRRVADWDIEQAAKRDTETNRLIAVAQDPATPAPDAVVAGRRAALALAGAQGVYTREAALAALGGSDAQVLLYARTGLAAAAVLDDRKTVTDLATSDNPKLSAAAQAVLDGSDAAVRQFLRTQDYPGRYTEERLKVNQILAAARAAGDVVLAQRAQQALDAQSLQAQRDFLEEGQFEAAATGRRVLVNQLLAGADSGPELKAAAQVALDGPPSAQREFLDSGRYYAAERDNEAAAHLAVVGGLLERINEVAETATKNALEAHAVAARANGDAQQAIDYANQATTSAKQAAIYADRAVTFANQAAQSVQKAAAAVTTARNAATRADASARSAMRSAYWAVTSYDRARQAAVEAHAAATHAYNQAMEAHHQAELAAAAAQEAYDAFVFRQGVEIKTCMKHYVDDLPENFEEYLTGSKYEWVGNCVANLTGDPALLGERVVENAYICDFLYERGSQDQQNCGAMVLDPAFTGTQHLVLYLDAVKAIAAGFVPLGLGAVAGCMLTACALAAGALLTIYDVGLNVFKLLNGDQSLARTLANLGAIALESLLLRGLGKVLSVGFQAVKALHLSTRNLKMAETGLQAANLRRLQMLGYTSCLRHSFDAATPVLLADGTYRPIGQIKVGDRMLATDPRTGRTGSEPVTRVLRHRDRTLTDVEVTGPGGATGTIRTTGGHPIWSQTSRSWVEASDLAPGTRLRTPTDVPATVGTVRSFTGSKVMYDLTLAGTHTFYVRAGAATVLVHNDYDCVPFPNLGTDLQDELDLADSLRVRPVSPGEVGFDTTINEGTVKWAMLLDGTLRVMPKHVKGEEIPHTALSRGAPVLSAGEAEIGGGRGVYYGLTLTNHSGHYNPSNASLDFAVQVWRDAGIHFPPGSIFYYGRD